MAETVEGGANIAWRLLATLEGGSLLLATSALLAYTARARVMRRNRQRNIQKVLITNTTNPLGRELKMKLEACRCTVTTVTSDATSEADEQIDALLVIGSEPEEHSLNHVAQLVSEDVFNNLKAMESQSPKLRPGGCIVWACAGAKSGAYKDAIAAFDTVIQTSLQQVARSSHCEAIWIGRCESAERAAERTLIELIPIRDLQPAHRFSLRNAAYKVSEYVGRWLKKIT